MKLLLVLIFATLSFSDVFEWEVEVKGENVEAVAERLTLSLKRKGIEVEKTLKLGKDYVYLFVCGERNETLAKLAPKLLTLYLCRVYVYRGEDGRVRVGYVNKENMLKVFERHVTKEGYEEIESFTEKVISALEEVR